MNLIENQYYSIFQTEDGRFIAEFESEAICGVKGFNFNLYDNVQERLVSRADQLVQESLNPRDPVLRKLTIRPQQQQLIP